MSDSDIEKRNRKIDLDKIIEDMFKEIDEINKSERSQGQKTQAFRRAAEKVTRALYGKRAKSKRDAITHNTASKYLTKIRNRVTAHGWLHHSLAITLERLTNKYPHCRHLIEPLQDLELEATRLGVKALKDKLLQADRLRKAISAINVDSTRYASEVNAASKAFEDWKVEVQKLKPVNKADRAQQKDALFALLDESGDLFNDLEHLKIDHEIMRWLVKDSFTAAVSSETSAFALSKKKGQTIDIDYPTIMARCEFLLSPVNPDVWNWEALATGIALATGRRAIEVLVQGEFVKSGTHKLMFSGQAKERGGVDRENQFEIYSLVEADTVLAAIKMLRGYSKITNMISELEAGRHYQFNELVHNRTAAYLNDFMRDMMEGANISTGIPDRSWVFKDTRAIYAAICFKLFFETDKRWQKMDQDMFFQTLLGHSDPKAQAHYKQFKILRAGQKWESIVTEEKNRLEELKRFDNHEDILASKAISRMHENVKKLIEQDPDIDIKQRTIKSNFGGNYATIRKYLGIVEEALSFDTTLETILKQDDGEKTEGKKPEPKEAKKAPEKKTGTEEVKPEDKPKFTVPKHLESGHWLVGINYHGIDYDFTVTADNAMKAMHAAWDEYQFCSSLPKKPFISTMQKDGWWIAQVKHKGQVILEHMGPGKKSEYVNALLVDYSKKFAKYWQ
ncbi:protelomerase family protein [Vibrio anguillarum]|uniref:protelomerase family protein n=3 Tax=Vibrio TaxID=662 RepID=UPI001F40CEBC|nr:protelomerase family protein [Vibrio anguillarum]